MDLASAQAAAQALLPYAPAAALAVSLLLLLIVLVQRGAARQEMHYLRLLSEQAVAGQRAEAETTRMMLNGVLHRVAADTSDRLAAMGERLVGLRGEMKLGIEAMRTTLSREQGDLRLALAEAQDKSGRQIGVQFENTRSLLEAKLREIREGNEGKLAEIQRTVNEQLHAAVEKQMNESFNRVIDQFTAVQKAMGDVQAVTAQIGDIKRLFSNVAPAAAGARHRSGPCLRTCCRPVPMKPIASSARIATKPWNSRSSCRCGAPSARSSR